VATASCSARATAFSSSGPVAGGGVRAYGRRV